MYRNSILVYLIVAFFLVHEKKNTHEEDNLSHPFYTMFTSCRHGPIVMLYDSGGVMLDVFHRCLCKAKLSSNKLYANHYHKLFSFVIHHPSQSTKKAPPKSYHTISIRELLKLAFPQPRNQAKKIPKERAQPRFERETCHIRDYPKRQSYH